jgi:hypothetical protein
LGRPEYGWRVKSSLYSTYVLVEYNVYWHHPTDGCFNSTGSTSTSSGVAWTKTPPADNSTSSLGTLTPGATDPKIGNLSGSASNVVSVVTVGDTTTVTYLDGSKDIIQKIANSNGTVTTVSMHFPSGVTVTSYTNVVNADGSVTTTVVTSLGTFTGSGTAGGQVALGGGITASNSTTANTSGGGASGGLLNQNAIGYRRISWKELIRD